MISYGHICYQNATKLLVDEVGIVLGEAYEWLPFVWRLLHVLHVKHQALEFLFDEPDLPGMVGLAEVLQVVVTVHVDDVKLLVLGVVALLTEPCVEGIGQRERPLWPHDLPY